MYVDPSSLQNLRTENFNNNSNRIGISLGGVSPLFKAFKQPCQEMEDGGQSDIGDINNNPFTKHLFSRLGPEFNPTNLINKNKKMFQHLNMLDGVALCAEDENYQRTFLDRIKIVENDLKQAPFNNKPTHIDKLFENEEQFLQSSFSSNGNQDDKSSVRNYRGHSAQNRNQNDLMFNK